MKKTVFLSAVATVVVAGLVIVTAKNVVSMGKWPIALSNCRIYKFLYT